MAYSSIARKIMTDAEFATMIRAKGKELADLLEEAHQEGLMVQLELVRRQPGGVEIAPGVPPRIMRWMFSVHIYRKVEL